MRRLRLTATAACTASLLVAGAAGCGGTAHTSSHARKRPAVAVDPAAHRGGRRVAHRKRVSHARPLALVAAESSNRLLIADLPAGKVIRRVSVASGPQYVAAEPGLAVVSSPAAGVVTLLERKPLHVTKVFHGFGAPHITEISPDGEHAYVTDDVRGTLSVIRLRDARVTSTIDVGVGAHHMGSSPNQHRLWIALGESAGKIVIVDTTDIDHPRVVGSFDPGFPAHDLSFSPDGRTVWVSSAVGPDVTVFRAGDHRRQFRVPVGPPPQHVAFHGRYAYLTSGYGSVIEKVAPRDGRVLKRARTPYGSFELDAADGFVATASLLNGSLAVFTPALRSLGVHKLAAATRDLAISDP
jgi:DNA-binding beta-propeller fold protein YncE